MKKWICLLLSLVAVPLMAQSANNYAMPKDVYDALVYVHKTGTGYMENLSAADKQILAPVKGLIFVQFGAGFCRPCGYMITDLEERGWMTRWKENGVRFFKIDTEKDLEQGGERLTSLWEVDRMPFLVALKDGKKVWSNIGYSSSSQSFFNKISELTETYKK